MNDNIDIRRNAPQSLRPFAEMNIAWIREMHTVEASDQYMYDHPESYMQGRNSIFSAHIGEDIAGVCALRQDEVGEFELTKMAVDPAFQGHGIGKILMDAVEAYAKNELRISRIYLLSNTKNAAALRLYERCGWIVNLTGAHPQYARCNIGMEKLL